MPLPRPPGAPWGLGAGLGAPPWPQGGAWGLPGPQGSRPRLPQPSAARFQFLGKMTVFLDEV